MPGAAAAGRLRRTRVVAKSYVTPRIIRVTVGGDLHDFQDQGTDQHVALYFFPPEAIIPDQLDLENVRALCEFADPRMRRYTIRRWDRDRQQVDFDFVVHHPAGPATQWALEAQPGDELLWWGPTPAWAAPTTGTLVLVGDETALPSIDATLTRLDPAVRASVVAEVSGERDQVYLRHHGNRADITWISRGEPDGEVVDQLASAVRAIQVAPGPVAVWAGAEFKTAGFLRRWFIGERGLTKDEAFIVSYWIYGEPQDKRADARNAVKNERNRREHPERAAAFIRAVPSG